MVSLNALTGRKGLREGGGERLEGVGGEGRNETLSIAFTLLESI